MIVRGGKVIVVELGKSVVKIVLPDAAHGGCFGCRLIRVVKHGGLQAFGPVDGTKRNCFAVHLSNRNERRSTVAHYVSNVRNCVHVRRDLSVLRGLGELPLVEPDVVVRGTGASSEVAFASGWIRRTPVGCIAIGTCPECR
jgi:hypothetical protein